tara:strand:+ start:2008 stop:2238 length:231 start_codon:yes stop_codon:yes gene_type:complete
MSITKLAGVGIETTTNVKIGIITATSFVKSDGTVLGELITPQLTIGVRSGAAVTFTVSDSSFNVINRAGSNIAINL